MENVDIQTALNVILGILTLILGYKNFQMSQMKDTQRESQEMTEIRVQLTQVMSMLSDLQKDVRTSTADFRQLSERVVKIETKLETAFAKIEELREKACQ